MIDILYCRPRRIEHRNFVCARLPARQFGMNHDNLTNTTGINTVLDKVYGSKCNGSSCRN